jgi:hypothetical protein
MSDLYDGKWLRQWGLTPERDLVCVADALDVSLLSAEERAAVEARNELARSLAVSEDEFDPEVLATPVEVVVRQPMPDLWPVDFLAILTISGYLQPILDWIDAIEDVVQREFSRSKLLNSAMYSRYDPMVLEAQPAIGISDQELDALWAWGASAYEVVAPT